MYFEGKFVVIPSQSNDFVETVSLDRSLIKVVN